MLPADRVQQIFALRAAGLSVRAIAKQFGHSPQTVRDYLHRRRTPGVRAVSRPHLLTDLFADYCRQRFAEDPHLRPSMRRSCPDPSPRSPERRSSPT